MTRTLAALALLAWLSESTAMAEPCAPRVALSGDGDAVARVAAELKQLGVDLGPAESSCSVAAMVSIEGEGISVAVQNAAKRSEGRVVSDPKIAAAWIDSWLRDEIEVASWAIAMPSAPVSSPSLQAPSAVIVAIPEAPASSPFDHIGFSAAYERSWTEDETTWDGFDVAACMRVGFACVGGRIRAGFQDDLVTNAATADRSDIVALATASIPFSIGQISIAPELGLGIGRTRTRRVEACTDPSPPPNMTPGCSDPTDPTCTMTPEDPTTGTTCFDANGQETNEIFVGDAYDKTTYLPRVALAVRFAFPIVRHVWLDAVAAYTLSPLTDRVDPDAPDTMVTNPTGTAMPPEPSRGYQLGVGLRVGIP